MTFSLTLPDSTPLTLQTSGIFCARRGRIDTLRLYLADDLTSAPPSPRLQRSSPAMACRALGVYAESGGYQRTIFSLSQAPEGPGEVQISTTAGKTVARTSFDSRGPGTYSVAWQQRGWTRGPLLCTVKVGSQTARTRIIEQ